MKDPFYGHRDWFTGDPIRPLEEWVDWDYALISALQVIEDHTDKHGLLVWEVDSDRVDVEAIKQKDKFQAAVERRTKGSPKKGYTPSPGEYFTPKMNLLGGDWPTYSEWIKELQEESAVQ